jgi:two-component system, OmpR family, sensor histidine kinase CpxA
MRSFFVQIFIYFWVTLLLTFVLSALIFPNPEHPGPETMRAALEASISQRVRFETVIGKDGCVQHSREPFFVFEGQQSKELCGRTPPAWVVQLAARALKEQHQRFLETDRTWAVAQPVAVADRPLVGVLLIPQPARLWFPHMPPWSLPVSAVVTFVLAYWLTYPVRALRQAFRRFAAGDMTVRLPVVRSPLRDWGGADVRTLMIDFNEMADRIQALVEAQKTLLRDVSHELRSPLARLNVALELAREDAPQNTTALDRAQLESNRLNALIGELLSLSLMETLKDVPNRRLISIVDVVDSLMPDLMFEAEARECQVIHKPHAPGAVMASEDLLRRAVENVIRNAIRYSPARSDVVVETFSEGGKAIIRVCDSGPGVPQESLDKIFRPFYRVDNARQSSTGGFGVGLAIAERTVQIHGGSIRAFNRQGGGLCVEMSIQCASQIDGSKGS